MMILLNHILNSNTPLYGNSGDLEIKKVRQINKGDTSNNSTLYFPAHSGTHIDAPFHFDNEGKTLSQFPADFWICKHPFLICKGTSPNEIISLREDTLNTIPKETDFLILKTGFENYRQKEELKETYIFNGPGISPEIGFWLRQNRNLKMIGFDFISLTSYSNRTLGREAHLAFLSKSTNKDLGPPILIIEDMKLSELKNTPLKVIIAPMFFEDADGSPVTVLAHTE